ncbi:MAG: hypothetical protein K8S20_11455 [Chloroflexi bacterium]|nr:hypothetical protein [Chloroflexota bacterium]
MITLVKERKLGFWDILIESWKIFRFKAGDIFQVVLFLSIPLGMILILVSIKSPVQIAGSNPAEAYFLFFLLVIQGVFSLVASMSIALLVESVVDQRKLSWIEATKDAFSKWGRAFLANFLAGMIVLALSFCLVIPGVVYSLYYEFVTYAVALRGEEGMGALAYSKKLVEGQWWRVFWILLGTSIVYGVIFLPFAMLSSVSIFLYYVSYAAQYLLGVIFSVVIVVLFLNNDFTYQRRLEKRTERARAAKKALPNPLIAFPREVENVKTKKPRAGTKAVKSRNVSVKANTVKAKKRPVRKSESSKNT